MPAEPLCCRLDAALINRELLRRQLGYGAGPRTHYADVVWGRADVAVCVVAPAAAIAFVALRVAGVIGDWYPFPDVSLPPVSVAGVACCLALAIPALVWRR